MPRKYNSLLAQDYPMPEISPSGGGLNYPPQRERRSLLRPTGTTSYSGSRLDLPTPQDRAIIPTNQGQENWWSRLGSDKQSALLRSVLTAGNVMQQMADPEGRHSFTRLSAGAEQGLNTYDFIRRQQKKERLAEMGREGLAKAGYERTDLGQAEAVLQTGYSTGDLPTIRAGFEMKRAATPAEAKPLPVKTLGYGEGLYQGGTILREPKQPEGKIYNIGGRGYKINKNYDPLLPDYPWNQELIPLTERPSDNDYVKVTERDAKGVETTRYVPKSEAIKGTYTKQPLPPKMPSEFKTESERVKFAESVVRSMASTIPMPSKTTYDREGYPIRNPNYDQELEKYNNQIISLRAKIYETYKIKDPTNVGTIKGLKPKRTIKDVTLPGEAPTGLTQEGKLIIPAKYKKDFEIARKNPKNDEYEDEEILRTLMGE